MGNVSRIGLMEAREQFVEIWWGGGKGRFSN